MGENAALTPRTKSNHGRSFRKEKERFTITLSPSTAMAFEELREWTDADTDSEVFRNALRFHKTMLRAHRDGKRFFMKEPDQEDLVAVEFFTEV